MQITQLKLIIAAALVGYSTAYGADSPDSLTWQVSAIGSGATGDFAPYLIGSNSGGRYAMKGTADVSALAFKDFNLSKRFSWAAEAELSAGYRSAATYDRYDNVADIWSNNEWRPSAATVNQLWAGIKFRGVVLWAGMRDHRSHIVDDRLSSGDMVLSNNARAIPQVQAGFVNFQNIPLTRQWVQIAGTIGYGKFTDTDALKKRYNYYASHITENQLFTYKNIYFRTRQDKPLAVTIGAQAAGEFGGTTYAYESGKLTSKKSNPHNFKAYREMFLPKFGARSGDGFYEGNHVGSWDLKARYRLNNGLEMEGYFQWYWEDGSSMAKRNCTDGLWGATVRFPGQRNAIKTVLVEYIDMRDQSGPIHWAPSDAPGTTITTEATGGDNYYNSTTFNAWANYGLGLGSSFPVAPLYNLDGNPQFLSCRTRGVHIAATGWLSQNIEWTAKFSHAVAWGTGRIPSRHALKNTSALVSAQWDASALLPGMAVAGELAFDTGKLRGDNFGALVKISYTGNFKF